MQTAGVSVLALSPAVFYFCMFVLPLGFEVGVRQEKRERERERERARESTDKSLEYM